MLIPPPLQRGNEDSNWLQFINLGQSTSKEETPGKITIPPVDDIKNGGTSRNKAGYLSKMAVSPNCGTGWNMFLVVNSCRKHRSTGIPVPVPVPVNTFDRNSTGI